MADSPRAHWRRWLHEVVFEAESPTGKMFDIVLLLAIALSVVTVAVESVEEAMARYGVELRTIEWVFTALFTAEYVLRLVCATRPWRYARSFFGIVDLIAILPTYASLFFTGHYSLTAIRALRLLRVFRILKLAQYVREAQVLGAALRASSRKIAIFLGTVLTLVLIIGSMMYLIEGEESGFSNIPQSMYWAIVTMTTVGYGDIAPVTVLGKFLASVVMLLGYGVLAVPTGVVTAEISGRMKTEMTNRTCPACFRQGHDADAKFCKYCGSSLDA